MGVVNDDSCGVHSRPYHSCVIACVMQVREVHAMGHDSGVRTSYTSHIVFVVLTHMHVHAAFITPRVLHFSAFNVSINKLKIINFKTLFLQ